MGASCSLDHISWLAYFQIFQENSPISITDLLGGKKNTKNKKTTLAQKDGYSEQLSKTNREI